MNKNEWNIRKNILQCLYKKVFNTSPRDFFRNCNKENDKMVKNPSLRMSIQKIERRWTEESVVAG